MLQRSSLAVDRSGIAARTLLIILVAGSALIALSILVRPNNHDEGQYVAAVALMRTGLPYRDFPFLQTPLQPLLMAPLAAVPAGWLLVAMRAVNGLFGLLTAWLLFVQLRGRVAWQSTAIALGGLLCTDAFLLAASNARNDALPMLLLTAAQGTMLASLDRERSWRLMAVAGVLFGLAISAKISAALPATGAAAFVLMQARRDRRLPIAFAAGMLIGLLPCAVMAIIAPAQFQFGVFSYSLDAPTQWWTSVGQAHRLEPIARILRLMFLSVGGVIAVGLVAAAADRRPGDARRLLDLLVIGGAIGAYLPEPAFTQYLVPLLPAVVARLAFAIDVPTARRKVAARAIAVTSVLGLLPTAGYAIHVLHRGPDLMRSVQTGRAISALAAGNPLVTLSPERVAGSDVTLDRRFATGPFLFRTFGALGDDALRYGFSPDWQHVDAALTREPPSVIMVGAESRPIPLHPQGLDAHLKAWAVSQSYRPVPLPDRQLTAYLRPATSTRSR